MSREQTLADGAHSQRCHAVFRVSRLVVRRRATGERHRRMTVRGRMSATPSKGRQSAWLRELAAALVFAMLQTALASAQAPISADPAHFAELRCNAGYSPSSCPDTKAEALQLLSLEHGVLERPLDLREIEMTGPGIVREPGNRGIGMDATSQTQEASVRWDRVVGQILLFTGIQHGVRLTERKTRRELGGPWLRDWFNSASSLLIEPTWSDGGGFFTNYVAHPMAGSVYAYIYRQNHPSDLSMLFGSGGDYVAHLARASTVSALSSLQFELGPLSESSLGNVGIPPHRQKMALVDIVVTPALGAAWMAGEDALDRYVIERLEPKIDNTTFKILIRTFLNPTRSMANVVALEKPWKRHGRS